MEHSPEQQLRQWYALETQIYTQNRRLEELNKEIPRLKWEIRQEQDRQLQYSSSLTRLLDGIRGKREEKEETLSQTLRRMEAVLNSQLQEKESLLHRMEQTKQAQAALPAPEELQKEGLEMLRAELELRYCTLALTALLSETFKALEELRKLVQGARMEVISIGQQQQIHAAPAALAEQCKPLLRRAEAAGQLLEFGIEPGAFFQSPAAYLANATQFTRMDRINQAMSQTTALKKQLLEAVAKLEA